MARLAVQLLHLFRDFGDISVEELAIELGDDGYSPEQIKRALFDNSDLFDHDGGSPRLWTVIERTGDPPEAAYRGPALRAWQRDALQEWIAGGRQGVVEAVTGTGKTAVGVAAIADAHSRGLRSLILVPGVGLMEQWHAVLRRQIPSARIGRLGDGHKDTFERHRIVISTVHSASNAGHVGSASEYLVVADEVHRYGAATFSLELSEKFTERLGLTATYERPDDAINLILTPYFRNLIDGCDYARANRDGIIAPVRVALVAVKFTLVELRTYSEADERAKDARSKLIRHCGVAGEPFGEFMQNVQELADQDGSEQGTWLARKYLKAFNDRRAVLAQSDAKMRLLRDIAPVLQGPCRSILFSETMDAANEAADVLSTAGVAAEAMTSALSTTERSDVMGRFRKGHTAALATPRLLDEGIDVPEAEVGVILAASRSRRQMIQRMGRIIRPKHDGRHAKFVIAYVEGTSEDPANGAHSTFLEQITEIAEVVETVSADGCADLLRSWLSVPSATAAEPADSDPAEKAVPSESAEAVDTPAMPPAADLDSGASQTAEDWVPAAVLDIGDEFEGIFTWDELVGLLPEPEITAALRQRDFGGRLTWTLVGTALVGAGGNDPASHFDRLKQLWALGELWQLLGADVTTGALLDAYRATPLKTLTIDRMCFLWESLDDASANASDPEPPAAVGVIGGLVSSTAPLPVHKPKQTLSTAVPAENEDTLNRGLAALVVEIERMGGSADRLQGTRRTALRVRGSDGVIRVARVRTRSNGTWQGSKSDADLSLDDTGSTCWVFVDLSVAPPGFFLLSADEAAEGVRQEVDAWLAADSSRRVEDQDHHAYRLGSIVHGRDQWSLLGLSESPPSASPLRVSNKSEPASPSAARARPPSAGPAAMPRTNKTTPVPAQLSVSKASPVGSSQETKHPPQGEAKTAKRVPAHYQGSSRVPRTRIYLDCDGFRTFAAYNTVTGQVAVTKSTAFPLLVGRAYQDPTEAAQSLKSFIVGDDGSADGMAEWMVDDGLRRTLGETIGR